MRIFKWRYRGHNRLRLSEFFKRHEVSAALMRAVKFHGGAIKVNGIPTLTNYFLKAGDDVSLQLPPELPNPNVKCSFQSIRIIFENRDFLVVDKPSGMASMPAVRTDDDTLLNRVKGYYLRRGYHNLQTHLATRLDKVTSGLVILAKNHFAHSVLDRQLKLNRVDKRYVAIVAGRVNVDHGEIDLPIERDPNSLIKRQIADQEGKPACTEFWVTKILRGMSLLKIKTWTGRTHQIRVHLKAIGHPIVGDWLYNPTDHRLNRLALHCSRIRFYDPFAKRAVVCHSKVPPDMKNLIIWNWRS